MRNWIDWAAEHRVGFLQLLPINQQGVEESPYSAISSIALDTIYLTFEENEIPMLSAEEIQEARDAMGASADASQVDYPAVRATKTQLLKSAWSRFHDAEAISHEEFEDFKIREGSWLEDHVLFRFLMHSFGESTMWHEWPESCQTPEGARQFLEDQTHADQENVEHILGYFAFSQWLCFRQWRAVRAHADLRGVKLMGDLPIGVSWHSSDVFFHREEFHLDWFGGSPPEDSGDGSFMSRWGQNWGVPLYDWEHMERNGFQWWRQRVARLTEIFHMFRLDHLLGFYRIYAFPWRSDENPEFHHLSNEQAAERTGGRLPRWFNAPDDSDEHKAANLADGDLRLRAILEGFDHIEVIAEDLGWVPEYVRPHLTELGIPGYKIPHWDCAPHENPCPGKLFPELSFVSYSTHDHDPLPAIWRGCVKTAREHRRNPGDQSHWSVQGAESTLRILSLFAGIPLPQSGNWPNFTDGIQWRFINALLASNSRYAVIMVTELFGLENRINAPGSIGAHNWTFRLPWTLSEIESDRKLADFGDKLQSLIGITRRWNHGANS